MSDHPPSITEPARDIPVRWEADVVVCGGGPAGTAAAIAAARHGSSTLLLERYGFDRIVISIKSPDVGITIEANRLIASKVAYPLHTGITESGIGEEGVIRSVVGLGTLLLDGIGDTIRVSLTQRDRRENVQVCRALLETLHIPYC